MSIEKCVRFPWSGGRHPWLDAYVETKTHIIGIESKRFEPFRGRKLVNFSEAYWRPVWGDQMVQFEKMRDELASGNAQFVRLDAVQLVKHAFGLRAEAQRTRKVAVLVYLYAEPEAWPDGKLIAAKDSEHHEFEIERFGSQVVGSEVLFKSLTYKKLLGTLSSSRDAGICNHADRIAEVFRP